MRFSIRDETLYRIPVRLAPHMLRLNPRADAAQIWPPPSPWTSRQPRVMIRQSTSATESRM
jgi:hypothetical protein